MYFDVHKNPNAVGHKYWWVAKGGNNETLCVSEMLSSKQACFDAIRVIKSDAATGPVYDETGETVGDIAARRVTV